MKFPAQRPVGCEGLQDWPRIGEPAGLDQDAPERRYVALLALGHQPAQRDLQVGARIAAQAAVAEQTDLVSAGAQQHIVDADAAELVDDDGGARALRRRQEMPNHRGFSRAEKAGDDGHRNACAAGAFQPAPKRTGIAGSEQL
jgi:hypothetical protein